MFLRSNFKAKVVVSYFQQEHETVGWFSTAQHACRP